MLALFFAMIIAAGYLLLEWGAWLWQWFCDWRHDRFLNRGGSARDLSIQETLEMLFGVRDVLPVYPLSGQHEIFRLIRHALVKVSPDCHIPTLLALVEQGTRDGIVVARRLASDSLSPIILGEIRQVTRLLRHAKFLVATY